VNLLYALRDKFGLDKIQILDNNEKTKQYSEKINNEKLKNNKKNVVKKILKCVSHENGYIDYKELFSDLNCIEDMSEESDNEDDSEKASELPINIEICSGSGIYVYLYVHRYIFINKCSCTHISMYIIMHKNIDLYICVYT
jgi:organic radical activating enzyme